MSLNEAETRAELIDPALKDAGWGVVEGSRIRREERITQGRLIGGGQRTKPEYADYVLYYRNQKMAVVEAKRKDDEFTEGLTQANHYAQRLQTPFAFSTNGERLYEVQHGNRARRATIDRYPTPDELWDRVLRGSTEAQSAYSGVIGSHRCPSRTRVASGNPATTSTTPSPRCSMPSPLRRTASS